MANVEYRGMNLVIPENDSEWKEYFAEARRHRLVVRKCRACGLLRYPPTHACPWCQELGWEWREVSGSGIIYSYEVVVQAIARMQQDHDVMRSDRLKQVMIELDPGFDEKDAGFSRFSKFVVEAGHRGLLEVQKRENGQYEVRPGPQANIERFEPRSGAGCSLPFVLRTTACSWSPRRARASARPCKLRATWG